MTSPDGQRWQGIAGGIDESGTSTYFGWYDTRDKAAAALYEWTHANDEPDEMQELFGPL